MGSFGSINISGERRALLSKRLAAEGRHGPVRMVVTRRPDSTAPIPLTSAQQQIWLADHLSSGTSPYAIPGGLRVRGTFDPDTFVAACEHVVRRHESLRTVFPLVDAAPVQVVQPDLRPLVRRTDLRGLAPADRDPACRTRLAALATEPFDLAEGPLFRVEVVTLANDEWAVLLVLHHVVGDLWSVGVLIREILTSYRDLRMGIAPRLPEMTLQFPDLAAYLATQAPDREEDLGWWEKNLAGLCPELPFVTDAPRPARPSHLAGSTELALTPDLVDGVRRLARSRQMTPFMAFAAIYHALLARISGEGDVAVGTPVMGRGSSEMEQLIGCLMNSVTLRCHVDTNATFDDHLSAFRQVCLDAFAHQEVPFEEVVARVAPTQPAGGHALFRTMITYQNVPFPRWQSDELHIEPVTSADPMIKYDLQLDLRDDHGNVCGSLVHARDLFSEATAQRWARHYVRLLCAAVTDPSARLSDVPLCDAQEQQEALALAAGVPIDRPMLPSLSHQVRLVAKQHPGWTAVVEGNRRFTYGELEESATQAARHLVAAGVQQGDVVALSLELGVDLLVGMLGTWKAGAAYLVMDPGWPAPRARALLEDCAASVVVTQNVRPEVAGDAQWITPSRLATGTLAGGVATELLLPGASPGSTAYVLYTSGSTGQPKGVAVTHTNLAAYVNAVPPTIGMGTPQAHYLALQAPVTDLVGTIMFASLATGGELYLLDQASALDADIVAACIREHDIDHVKIVPTHLDALTRVTGAAALIPRRSLVLGGEAAAPGQVMELLAVAGQTRIHNHYGPTESTIGVVTCDLGANRSSPFVPLGRPVPGMRCYVVRDGQLVPPGIAGELWVAGPQVSDGYINQPELTASRFVEDLFGCDGGRAYRTGDKVCWTETGQLRFFGREDAQVKIRGYRVELAEVEETLLKHPGVSRAAVTVGADSAGAAQLNAYIVSSEASVDAEEIRHWVAQQLPRQCVPSTLTILDALPLTSNGKVDRPALPAPAPSATATPGGRPPAPGLETTLAAAFTEVLGLDRIGATETFFELGGDSLRAIQLVSAARRAGVTLSTQDVFVHESVAGIAAAVASRGASAVITHDDGVGECAPSAMLRRLRRLDTTIDGYSHRVLVTLPEGTTAEQAAAALERVVNHHKILAATLDRDSWTLRVPRDRVPGPVVDTICVPEEYLRSSLLGAVSSAVAALDPWKGHHVEARLFERSTRLPLLLLVVHHVVVDGVSWQVILEDLRTALAQVVAGTELSLPPVATSARAWAQAVYEDAQTPQRRAETDAWRKLSRDVASLRATGVLARGVSAGERSLLLDTDLSRRLLLEIPQGLGASAHEVLLAAVALAVRQSLGTHDDGALLVDVESHGRHLAHLDSTRTVGWLTAVYPVRVELGESPDDDDSMRSFVRRAVVSQRSYPHDGLGYGALRYLTEDSPLRDCPEPQLVFNYLGQQETDGEDAAWQPVIRFQQELLGAGDGSSPLLTRPLHINTIAVQSEDGLRLQVQVMWDEELWTVADAQELVEALMTTMTWVAHAGFDTERGPLPLRQIATIWPSARRELMPVTHQQLNKITEPVGADSIHHNVVATVVLEPGTSAGEQVLDVDALQRALNRVREKHEVLRTRLRQHDDGWSQQVEDSSPWPLEVWDLRNLTNDQAECAITDVVTRLESTSMPVAEGTPMRTALLRTGDRRWILSQAFHHASVDPWGFAQFVEDLADLYLAQRDGTSPRRPPLPVQVADLAAWQQRQNELGPGRAHADYWRTLLADCPAAPTLHRLAPNSLPARNPGSSFVLPSDQTAMLKAAAASLSVSMFVYLLTVFQLLHSIATQSDDVLVTVPLAGRDEPETHPMVGYLVNEVTVRTRIPSGATFASLLSQVRTAVLDAQEHQQAPLRALAATTPGRWDPMRTMFNLVDFGSVRMQLGDLVGRPWRPAGTSEPFIPEIGNSIGSANLDLYLVLHERNDELRGLWMQAPGKFDESAVADLRGAWPLLLDAVMDDPDLPLAAVPSILAAGLTRGAGRDAENHTKEQGFE